VPINEFGPDGTQAPPPPRVFPDPLAGLVTADTWTVSKWSGQWAEYAASRVVAPIPPTPTEEMRQAIWAAMDREQRHPRTRRQRAPQQQTLQQFAPALQFPVAQQQQPAKQPGGVAAFIGCLIVIGFFVLVVVNILGAIFSG
jgi:hypothetical protein